MEQRPQGTVGVTVVIFLDVLLFQVDRRGGDALGPLHVDVAGEMIGLLARPPEPQPAILPQRRFKRHAQSALRAGRRTSFRRRHAIGDDDKAAHRTELHGLDNKPAQLINPTSE